MKKWLSQLLLDNHFSYIISADLSVSSFALTNAQDTYCCACSVASQSLDLSGGCC